MGILEDILAANKAYAARLGDKSGLTGTPTKRIAVLTCMDGRLDPSIYAGLAEGDALVIRNAGGRASDDAIRSLVISYKLLGTREWFVIQHTDCGTQSITDEIMRGLLRSSLDTSYFDEAGWHDHGTSPGSTEGDHIDWLTIDDHARTLTADVQRIRKHPLVPARIPIYGFIYDVKTGLLNEVPEAMAAGKAG
jgi:carbonic anhydrase